MKNVFFVFFAFFFAFNNLYSDKTDSLRNAFHNYLQKDSVDLNDLVTFLNYNFKYMSLNELHHYENYAKINNPDHLLNAYYYYSLYFTNKNNDSTLKYALLQDSILKKDNIIKPSVKRLIADMYELKKQYTKALAYYDEAIIGYKRENNIKNLAYIYTSIGTMYFNFSKLDLAEEYFNKVNNLSMDDSELDIMANTNIIGIYLQRGEIDDALLKSEVMIKKYKNTKYENELLELMINLSSIYQFKQQYDKSITLIERILSIKFENQDSTNISIIYNNLGSIYGRTGKYQKAIDAFENGLKYHKIDDYTKISLLQNLKSAYNHLMLEKIKNNELNDDDSLNKRYSNTANSLDSTVFLQKNMIYDRQIGDAMAKYETNRVLNEKKIIQLENAKTKQNLLYMVILFILLIIFTIILVFQNNIRKKLNDKLLLHEAELKSINEDLFDKIDKLIKSVAFKDKLLSVISHDLQTPVQSIKMLSERIKLKAEEYSKEKLLHSNDILNEISEELSMLLNNLLTWIKAQGDTIQVEKSNFFIKEITDDIINLYQKTAEEKNIKLINNIADDSLVFADRNMIATVIRNLLSNSIKFSKKNATVSINSEEKDNSLKICIKDQSDGIPNEKLDKIFNLDKKDLSPESNGLGLKISKEFVEMNGGEIYAKSEVGIGSEFGFVI